MRRPISHALTGVAAGFVLAVAGCAIPTDITYQPAVEASEEAVDEAAKAELLAAFGKLSTEPFSVEVSMGDVMAIAGSGDPTIQSVHLAMSVTDVGETLQIEMIMIGTDLWMSMGDLNEEIGVATRWMYADLSELEDVARLLGVDTAYVFGPDPNQLLAGIETVTKVDDHTFEGELDPLAGYRFAFGEVPPELEDAELTIRFTAVLDNDGRVTRLSMTIPGMPPGAPDTIETRYFDHGVPVDISPPPAEDVSPMPEELLATFGISG